MPFKFEYLIRTYKIGNSCKHCELHHKEAEDKVNELGKQGWKVVSASRDDEGDATFVFERPIKE